MCMNSGALFPSSINGWVNKRTFTLGLQNVNPHSEMPDVLSRVFRKTTCDWTTQLVRLHKALLDAQPLPNSMISSLLARLYKWILKFPPKPHWWMSRKSFLKLKPHAESLRKATMARIMFNWQTKTLSICGHTSQCWQRGNSAWISSDHTITHPWQTRRLLHFFTGHINFSFNLFIRVGIKKRSTELGRGLRKDYTAVSSATGDTCLGCTRVGGEELEYSWPNYALCTRAVGSRI